MRLTVHHGFEELNLNRIAPCVMEDNPAGVRVHEKAGFKLEGRFRRA